MQALQDYIGNACHHESDGGGHVTNLANAFFKLVWGGVVTGAFISRGFDPRGIDP